MTYARIHSGLFRWLSFLAAGCALSACDNGGSPGEAKTGEVAFALVAHTSEHRYRLRDAKFDIMRSGGDIVASLDSELEPDAELLKERLDPGAYHVQLQEDWLLTRADPDTAEVVVHAFLESPMSGGVDFAIADGVITSVPYTFTTDGVPIGFGTGKVAISIGVNEQLPTTRLDLSTSTGSVSTELGTTTEIALTLSASQGFSGLVGLAGSLLDGNGNPMTGWSLDVVPATIQIPADGVALAKATLTIPTQNRGLSATARFIASSAAGFGTHSVDVPISALNQYTIDLAVSPAGQCMYPPAGTLLLTQGTKLRWLNTGTQGWLIHTNGFGGTCPHQPDSDLKLGGESYECLLTAITSGSWYCHTPGSSMSGLNVQVVAP
ncbi:Hypothetical protein A7982_11024 [Minicystis rosea]|nr:Hypothetical protein A7982_11024 [Minicystis rosea]